MKYEISTFNGRDVMLLHMFRSDSVQTPTIVMPYNQSDGGTHRSFACYSIGIDKTQRALRRIDTTRNIYYFRKVAKFEGARFTLLQNVYAALARRKIN